MNELHLASLIKFKPGTTFEEAVAALKTIKHLLDIPPNARNKDIVEKYNPDYGSPIFYIP